MNEKDIAVLKVAEDYVRDLQMKRDAYAKLGGNLTANPLWRDYWKHEGQALSERKETSAPIQP